MSRKHTDDRALKIIKAHGGQLRMTQAIQEGIARRTFYRLVDQGRLECITRGVYRLTELPEMSNPDLVTVALRSPQSVVCLVSALSFHELTTQVPHQVWIALPRGSRPPRIDYPPITWFEFSGKAYESGIEVHSIDQADVRVYAPEKTIADCFKYRNKIGIDVVLESLELYMRRDRRDIDGLFRYAQICRVAAVMRPYVEAMA